MRTQCIAGWCGLGLALLFQSGQARATASEATLIPAQRSYNAIVQNEIAPHTEQLLATLAEQGHGLTMQGDTVFDGRDKFLPGKIAVALADVLVSLARNSTRFSKIYSRFEESQP